MQTYIEKVERKLEQEGFICVCELDMPVESYIKVKAPESTHIKKELYRPFNLSVIDLGGLEVEVRQYNKTTKVNKNELLTYIKERYKAWQEENLIIRTPIKQLNLWEISLEK